MVSIPFCRHGSDRGCLWCERELVAAEQSAAALDRIAAALEARNAAPTAWPYWGQATSVATCEICGTALVPGTVHSCPGYRVTT